MLGVVDAVALLGQLIPEFGERAHLADFGDELEPGVDEERDAADDLSEVFSGTSPEALTVSSTAMAVASANESSCTGVAPASCR